MQAIEVNKTNKTNNYNKAMITILSEPKDDHLKFTLSGVDVSVANAIRRAILADIPIVVFRVSPNNKNKCNIIANTCGLHNEVVKHRLSCIPIHIKDVDDFPLKNYIMELNVQNNTDTTIYVTSKDFKIQDTTTGKYLEEDKVREIFPPDDITGYFIDFVRLKPKPAEELQAKIIHLTCEFDIGSCKEDGAYNVASTCCYGNTIDITKQESELQILKQKWKDEGKTPAEIEFDAKNWKLLDGKRIFVKNSFDFTIQTIGIYSNIELLILACKITNETFQKIYNFLEKNEIAIQPAESTLKNCFDISFQDLNYTTGKVIEYFMLVKYYEIGIVTFCSFAVYHPHDNIGTLRLAYKDAVEISYIKSNVLEALTESMNEFTSVQKEFSKYNK
jgi:DNA-directed RNA polymerase subunit L